VKPGVMNHWLTTPEGLNKIHIMSTYTQLIYQLIFGPENRQKCLIKENRDELFKYIAGILKESKCHVYQINGIEDHLHIVTHIHPSVAISSLVKNIKVASNNFIKDTNLFPGFRNWQEGYAAFSYSYKEKNRLIEYVSNQELHHKKISYREELKNLLNEHGVIYEEQYLL
jgi:REP element-mobilizing transposase RayT